jgi:hypothetical protein
MEIVVTRQVVPKDFVAANWLHAGLRRLLLWALFLLALFAFIPLSHQDPHALRDTAILWIIAYPIVLVLIHSWWGYRARKVFLQYKALRAPREIRITDDAFHVQSEVGQARLPWSHFYKWKANKGIVLLYQSDRLFQMMPRHLFASDEQFNDFKALLARAMGPMNQPRKSNDG